jgi:dienelactone hydrolase
MRGSSDLSGIPVLIESGAVVLDGDLSLPDGARGLVLFAHGSGSGRHSPRNQAVARFLEHAGLGTLLMDLLTVREEREEAQTAHLRFNIGLLAQRLLDAADWLLSDARTQGLALGCFGASTGAAAALVVAASRPGRIVAVVSRGGRPDLAGSALPLVRAPTLLIVGGEDHVVIDLNKQALARLGAQEKQLRIVPGATHLFEEPGTLDEVAHMAADWFSNHLGLPSNSSGAEVRSQ